MMVFSGVIDCVVMNCCGIFGGMHCFHLQGEIMVEVGAEVIESQSC